MTDARYARYARNQAAITEEEQQLLAGKRVLVVGCGGLGGYVIENLARIGVGFLRAPPKGSVGWDVGVSFSRQGTGPSPDTVLAVNIGLLLNPMVAAAGARGHRPRSPRLADPCACT